jgi:Cdc6-like AAA superfamily ATPase
MNTILGRDHISSQIEDILRSFNKNDLSSKKGIYIYGESGSGKTEFITKILQKLNYDVIKYDAGDIRNKNIIEMITTDNISSTSVLSILTKNVKKIAIIMDEIDGMNNGDKGGINSLIKLIRPKKTKKQKLEETTNAPIICISNYHIDKKIKELMKVCNVFEIKQITLPQIKTITTSLFSGVSKSILKSIITYVQNDLRKINILHELYCKNKDLLTDELFSEILQLKMYNNDTKKISQKIIFTPVDINEHLSIVNETDRTIIGLLYHENIIDALEPIQKQISIPLYSELLDNMCFSDYIDRITFQNQIWQFNEMSSLLKTFRNNNILHQNSNFKKIRQRTSEARFTKVLTKYSTEYNNTMFIQSLCQKTGLCKSDLFLFFLNQKEKNSESSVLFENDEITKLDMNRICKYLDRHTKYSTGSDAEITAIEEDMD